MHHSYADDTQLYIAIKEQDRFADKLFNIEQCVSEIIVWMNHNMHSSLCSNLKNNVNMFAEPNVQFSGIKVRSRSKIKNLGVTFDQTLSMQAHVNCQKLFFTIWETEFDVSSVRKQEWKIIKCYIFCRELNTLQLPWCCGLVKVSI